MRKHVVIALLAAVGLGAAPDPAPAAAFEFVHAGTAGTGLQDTTPAQPVGGNPGTTLGAQRLEVFRRAGETFGRYLVSPVPIRVTVTYANLGSSVLGAAGPASTQAGFTNAPSPGVFYPIALANSLAGTDLHAGPCINVDMSTGANFYLGLDNEVPTGRISMLDVILHEMAHGLGFISYAGQSDAAFPIANMPDVFSTRILDLSTRRRWDEKTSQERMISRTNAPHVVWAGPYTTAAHPYFLQPGNDSVLAVVSPTSVARDYAHSGAAFGGAIPAGGLSAPLVLAQDGTTDAFTAARACQPLTNAAAVAGRIVLIRRGGCNFDVKVLHAQQAGAAGVIMANHLDDSLVNMAVGTAEVSDQITIPALFVGQADGNALEAASPGVQVRFGSGERPAGSLNGRVRLHAPGKYDGGSSIAHWSTDAGPDLLMEPFINRSLDPQLDLTLTMMKDIGWRVVDIPLPHLTYETWAAEFLPAAVTRRAPRDDPQGDGLTNLERYFFGLTAAAGPDRLPTLSAGATEASLHFTRSILPTDLTVTYEKSHDLAAFTPAVAGIDYLNETVERLDNQSERVTLDLPAPITGRVFWRLRVHQFDP